MFLHGTGTALQFTPLCRISSHLPDSKFRDSTCLFSWRKEKYYRRCRANALLYSFNPVSLDDVAAQSGINQACVRLLRQVNFLHDIPPAVIGFLPFNVQISYFESNVLGITFVVWQEQWKKWQQKGKKKVSKNLNHPCSVLNTSDKILC